MLDKESSRITTCRSCGIDVGKVSLDINTIWECNICGCKYVQDKKPNKCLECGACLFYCEFLNDYEKIAIDICDFCKELEIECVRVVHGDNIFCNQNACKK